MQAKKTARKAAKKGYKPPAKKKAVPRLKQRMTLEEYIAFSAKISAETDARIAKAREETEKVFQKSREETEKALQKSREETEKVHRETEKALQELSAEVKRVTSNLENIYGGVSSRLGKITELIVVPKLRHNMNAQGHNFERAEPDALIRGVINGRKEDIAQLDMLLSGPTEAMAVEVKSRLKESSVREHLGRLQGLRDHEVEAGIKGKKLFGAVVGVAIDEFARKVARENGLYIVEIHEEEGKLKVEKPETCRTW